MNRPPISQKLFSEVKQEHKEGHTPGYSALLHDLEIKVVQWIVESKEYKDYQFFVKPNINQLTYK
jgi:hypothetical protein